MGFLDKVKQNVQEGATLAKEGVEKVLDIFRAELTLTPDKPGQAVEITVLRGTAPYELKLSAPAAVPDGVVLAGEVEGSSVEPAPVAEVRYIDRKPIDADEERLKRLGGRFKECFMTAPSPGIVATTRLSASRRFASPFVERSRSVARKAGMSRSQSFAK